MARINIAEKIYNTFPNDMTVSGTKKVKSLKWIGENISSPQNRAIMGATALMSQPFIDWNNQNVDEKTRKVSTARTIAKIIAGTLTGVTIRYGTIKLIKSLSKVPEVGKQLNALQKLFTPSSVDAVKFHNPATKEIEKSYLNQYCNSVGTLLGLVVMLYTNFKIDIPITKYFTKVFSKKFGVYDENNPSTFRGGQK